MSFLIVEWAMGFLKYALFCVLINVFYTSDFNASTGGKCTLSLSFIVSKCSSMFLKDAMRRGVVKGINFFDVVIISHLLIVVVIIIFLYILQGHGNGNQHDLSMSWSKKMFKLQIHSI